MKKFLVLLFVCAGLTAMAAPQVNKADLVKVNKGQMVMKSNTMAQHFTAAATTHNFMVGAKQALKTQRVKPENLVNQRAPRQLSDADIVNTPGVMFEYIYDISGDEPVPADPCYNGGSARWYPDASQGLYIAGLYYPATFKYTWYLPIDIDYTTGDVSLSWGLLLEDDSVIGTARNRVDSVYYEILVSQDYWENGDTLDCMGSLYTDGSIIFDDNYVYYSYLEERTYRNSSLQSTNVTEQVFLYVGTEILAANGELTYTEEQDGSAGSNPVFMYQSNDTLYVGNLWDYGMPSVPLTISPEAKMNYNCIVTEDGEDYLYNPLWDIKDSNVTGGLGNFYGIGAIIEGEEGYDVEWGFEGDVTPEQITWDYASMCNGYHILYGWLNNVLRWTNGNQFVIPTPQPQGMRGDVNDDQQVNIADVTALIDALLSQDWDSINYDNADCNLDGTVQIADVTTLIDFLLTGVWPAAE